MGLGNIDLMSGDVSSTSQSGSTIGDNSYHVDNRLSLDLGGATIDTSTNVGLFGQDLATVGGVVNNAFATILSLSNQNQAQAQNTQAILNQQVNGGLANQMGHFIKENGVLIFGSFGMVLIYFLQKKKGRKK